MFANPNCEFILYLQQHPIDVQLPSKDQSLEVQLDLNWLERELRYPTGSPLPRRTPLSFSMVGFSPDCGFIFESKGPPKHSPSESHHLVGAKTEEYNVKAKDTIVGFTILLSVQLIFLIRQMKETATPSTRNRVSFYTIAMLAFGDGFAFLALIFMHLFLGTAQLPLYTTAFLSLFSVVFELRFLMDIWAVQATEQMRQDRQQASTTGVADAQPTPPQTQATSPAQTDGLPLPATAARPGTQTPVIIAPDQDAPTEDPITQTQNGNGTTTGSSPRAELGALYSRYCLLLIGIFFATLHATTVRQSVRAFYFNTLSFVYLSFWCPQIYRNIMRNCRKALRWDFVLGQSIIRMIPIAYFYAVADNVLFSKPDTIALFVLAGWVWVQIVALASQDILGSRFFIREGWAPPAYDYHPILREDEEGATMPIGSSQTMDDEGTSAASNKPIDSKTKGEKIFDCSICTQDIEVPVIPSDTNSEGAPNLSSMILQRRAYMVTPCRHIFHTPCLEGWMRYRLQCPNCREILPPL
jgi:transmembrane E3 ubiquitin-protein ligase